MKAYEKAFYIDTRIDFLKRFHHYSYDSIIELLKEYKDIIFRAEGYEKCVSCGNYINAENRIEYEKELYICKYCNNHNKHNSVIKMRKFNEKETE